MTLDTRSSRKLDELSREELLRELTHAQAEVTGLREQIELQQITDQLTGLANRDYFFASFGRLWRRALRFKQMVCLAIVDIDDFRSINERYGHMAGDLVLSGLADILRSIVRDYDLLARFGEEEFAIAMDNSQPNRPQQLSQRILKAVESNRIMVNERVIPMTVTIGVTSGRPEDIGESCEPLIRSAAEALEVARNKGRGQFHCLELVPTDQEPAE
ncbi:MAG: Phytochrome-like protein cph2 [Phycisphaerae bacterium]|nr:Phytochrome-like protein cph2 [Phycisphaerae bacterium]